MPSIVTFMNVGLHTDVKRPGVNNFYLLAVWLRQLTAFVYFHRRMECLSA